MNFDTPILYLLGGREQILAIAADPWSLAIGAVLVLSAGFARHYARTDLSRQPWKLAIPLLASTLSCLALWLLVSIVGGLTRNPPPSFWRGFLSLLGLYWMTAPLAWLYAIPFERWLSRGAAVRGRLWTLGIVAIWRVLLMIRVLHVTLDAHILSVAFLVILYGTLFAGGLVVFTLNNREGVGPPPIIIHGMAAIGPTVPFEDQIVDTFAKWLPIVAVLALPVSLLGLATTLGCAAHWQFNDLRHSLPQPPTTGVILVAAASILFWALILPTTQRQQRNASHIAGLFAKGDSMQAVERMASLSLHDFPRLWQPPPAGRFSRDPPLLDLLDAAFQKQLPQWLETAYLRQLEDYTGDARWYWRDEAVLAQLARVITTSPRRRELADRALKAIAVVENLIRQERKAFGSDIHELEELEKDGLIPKMAAATPARIAAMEELIELAPEDTLED